MPFYRLRTGLCALRSRLRFPHPGQRVSGASARHQDLQEGRASRYAHRQDERAHQEDHHAGTEGTVRHAQRMRRVARGVAGTCETRALQMPIRTMEPSATVPVVRVVVVESRRRTTTDSQRQDSTGYPRLPKRTCSRPLHAGPSRRRADSGEHSLRPIKVTASNHANSTVPNVGMNERTNKTN